MSRYTGPKGTYWKHFAKAIRERDLHKYGTCISCGSKLVEGKFDAGHYVPASNCGFALLFDPKNVHGECKGCNGFDEFHLVGYRKGLLERYGQEFVEDLEKRRDDARFKGIITKQWTPKQFKEESKKMRENGQELVAL